jgi:hypothetical protein
MTSRNAQQFRARFTADFSTNSLILGDMSSIHDMYYFQKPPATLKLTWLSSIFQDFQDALDHPIVLTLQQKDASIHYAINTVDKSPVTQHGALVSQQTIVVKFCTHPQAVLVVGTIKQW